MLNFPKLFLGTVCTVGGTFVNSTTVVIDEFYNENPAVWLENLENALATEKQELTAILQELQASEQRNNAVRQKIEATEQREKTDH
jgi:hypothetical protein